jgi:hypothetical protein
MMQATEGRVARGWESKAIESQQDDAERRGAAPGPREPSATDARRTLELARAQVVLRRDAAKNDAQRAAADRALEAIAAQLAAIEEARG